MNWTTQKQVTKPGLSPLVKGQQVLGQAVHGLLNDVHFKGDYQLVKAIQKQHASSPANRKSMDILDSFLPCNSAPGTAASTDSSVTVSHLPQKQRIRTWSADSQASVEEELIILRQKVEEQGQTMESLQVAVLNMQDESKNQQKGFQLVQKKFHGHRVLIDRTLQQTQMALQDQQELLYRQDSLIKTFEKERTWIGSAWTDSCYILLGMYVIQTPLVKYTIQLITMRISKNNNSRKWLPRFLNLLLFMHFINMCKSFDSYIGLSTGISSLLKWTGRSVTEAVSNLTRVSSYNRISYSSTAMQDWKGQRASDTVGLNNILPKKAIPKDLDSCENSKMSLDIC